MSPYSVAFLDETNWILFGIDLFVDSVFLIDIFVNFFIAYYDKNYKLVDNRG